MTASIRAAAGRIARLALLLACLAFLLGRAPSHALATRALAAAPAPGAEAALLADLEAYADALAADLDAYWAERLAAAGVAYRRPEVVFYTDTVRTPCDQELVPGVTTSSYYCPIDERIYLDGVDNVATAEAFGRSLLPTVIGHEWSHHVQMLLGTFPDGPNHPKPDMRRLELQADCLTGGWTADAEGRGLIEADAVDVAVYALAYYGRPLRADAGRNQGDGTSKEQVRAFLRGYDHGTAACFAPASRPAATL